MTEYKSSRKGKQADQGSAPPAVQRQKHEPYTQVQKKSGPASSEQVQTALEASIRGVRANQPGKHLNAIPEVGDGFKRLCGNHDKELSAIQNWLNGPNVPDDPLQFTQQALQRLPGVIDIGALKSLRRMPVQAKPPTLYEKGRQTFEPKPPLQPTQHPPHGQTSDERINDADRRLRIASGKKPADPVGPFSTDVLPFGKKAAQWLKKKQPATEAPSQRGEIDPKVERTIQQMILPDSLIPAEVTQRRRQAEQAYELAGPEEEAGRLKARREAEAQSDSYPDAQEVARELAWKLDQAHQLGETRVQLQLGEIYLKVRNREGTYQGLNRIVQVVRNALPHRASHVQFVDIYFGKEKIGWIVRLDAPAQRGGKK